MIRHVTHTHTHTVRRESQRQKECVTFFSPSFLGVCGWRRGWCCLCVCVRVSVCARVWRVCVCVLSFDFHRAGHDEIFRTIKLKSANIGHLACFTTFSFLFFLLILTDITGGLNVCSHTLFFFLFQNANVQTVF